MLTAFNRKELLTTNSMKRQGEVRAALHQADIEFQLKVHNATAPFAAAGVGRGRTAVGLNQNYIYTYIFYVHKQNYEKALHVIAQTAGQANL